MISPGCSSVSALLAEVTDTRPQCQLTHRNAITWKTGNSGYSASFFNKIIFSNGTFMSCFVH